MTIYRHECRTARLSVLIWAAAIAAMSMLTMLLYPAFKDQSAMLTSILSMMGPFTAALGLDQLSLTTAVGFYGIETGTMLAIGGAMFAALTGIGLLSKEEGGHTAEFLLTQPVPRPRVVLEKLLALATLLLVLNVIVAAVGALCFALIGEPLPVGRFALFHALQWLMHLQIGCLCVALSAFARRAQSGLGLGIALLLYFLSLLRNIVDAAAFLRYVTPFSYAEAHIAFTKGVDQPILVVLGIAVTLAACATATIHYTRKDIAA